MNPYDRGHNAEAIACFTEVIQACGTHVVLTLRELARDLQAFAAEVDADGTGVVRPILHALRLRLGTKFLSRFIIHYTDKPGTRGLAAAAGNGCRIAAFTILNRLECQFLNVGIGAIYKLHSCRPF